MRHKICLNIFALAISIISPHVFANVGLSIYRIHLDPDHSTENFTVRNKDSVDQECELSLKHYTYDKNGNIGNYTGKEPPKYAADDLIRFSPKHFELPALQQQTVRFTMRRKKDTEQMEHRAYLVVSCSKTMRNTSSTPVNSQNVAMSLGARIETNLPIIVRPSNKLSATAKFSNVKLENGQLSFDLLRSGSRSLYGYVEILDKKTNEVLTQSGAVLMYIETSSKSFVMTVDPSFKLDNIVLRYRDDTKYGGDTISTWSQ